MSRHPMLQRLFKWHLTPLRIAIIYAFLGALWILLSDTLLAWLVRDPTVLTHLQTFKGWFYILVTASLLYVLIRRSELAVRKSEEALREKTRQLQVLIDTAPVGIVIHSAPDGRLLLFNRAAEMILGWPLAPDLGLADQPTYLRRPRAGRQTLSAGRYTRQPLFAWRDLHRYGGGHPPTVRV